MEREERLDVEGGAKDKRLTVRAVCPRLTLLAPKDEKAIMLKGFI